MYKRSLLEINWWVDKKGMQQSSASIYKLSFLSWKVGRQELPKVSEKLLNQSATVANFVQKWPQIF